MCMLYWKFLLGTDLTAMQFNCFFLMTNLCLLRGHLSSCIFFSSLVSQMYPFPCVCSRCSCLQHNFEKYALHHELWLITGCVASPTIANVKDQTEAEVAMGYTMTEICDKFIEFFMYMKPETKDWRKLLVFREEWQRYRGHFYKRCQVRIHIEADPSLKQKLVVLARKVKKVSPYLFSLDMITLLIELV